MGRLYLIPTPIGNADDITKRALEILGDLSVLACEDTRTTRRLLREHDLRAPKLLSYTEHNKRGRIPQLVGYLSESDVGLVSEAGMPGISDPGQELVAAAIEAGHSVIALPGPSAALAALAASGLSTRRFFFLGFLPRTAGRRRSALQEVEGLAATLIVFESPRRVLATLGDIESVLGDRRIAVAREISKVHEEFIRGRVSEVRRMLSEPLGEFTLVIEGATADEHPADDDGAIAAAQGWAESPSISTRDLAQRLQSEFGLSRRRAYAIATRARGERS